MCLFYLETSVVIYFPVDIFLKEPKERQNYLNIAREYIDASLYTMEHYGKRRLGNSLMLGSTGVYVIAFLIYDAIPEKRERAQVFYNYILSLTDSWLTTDSEDEFLYGKAGFLNGLLSFHGYNDNRWQSCARKIILKLFENGRNTANSSPWSGECSLLYQWHNKFYIGAAHGTAGIIHSLLLAADLMQDSNIFGEDELKETCEFLYRLRSPETNNYFSSLDSKRSELVQWCHGAPGFVYLFCKAAEHFFNETYLERAFEASILVWNFGWLLKGPGLW